MENNFIPCCFEKVLSTLIKVRPIFKFSLIFQKSATILYVALCVDGSFYLKVKMGDAEFEVEGDITRAFSKFNSSFHI